MSKATDVLVAESVEPTIGAGSQYTDALDTRAHAKKRHAELHTTQRKENLSGIRVSRLWEAGTPFHT